MKKNLLRFIYKRFPRQFEEFIVEDFIGTIPEKVQDDALEFLVQGKNRLEKWIFFNSYHLQRRAVGDLQNAQLYQGMMLFLKILLTLTGRPVISEGPSPVNIPEEKESPLDMVADFVRGMRDFKNPPKEETK